MHGTSAVTTLSRQGLDAQGTRAVIPGAGTAVTPAGSQRLGKWGEGMRRRRAHFSTDLMPLYQKQACVAVRPLRQSRRLRRATIVSEPRRTPCTDITDAYCM